MTRPAAARRFAHLNYHAALGRLGGAAGASLQRGGFDRVKARVAHYADTLGLWVFLTTDDNDHTVTKPHPRAKLIARQGIDKVWAIPPKQVRGQAKPVRVEVLQTKIVDLTIDGHNAVGAQVRITFPTGRAVVLWIVQANFGRHATAAEVQANMLRVKRGYHGRMLLGCDEIDEADAPDEHAILRDTFPASEGWDIAGWGTLVPIVVPAALTLHRVNIAHASNGMKRVSPPRVITEAVLAA